MPAPSIEQRMPNPSEEAPPLEAYQVDRLPEERLRTLISVGGVMLNGRGLGLVQTNSERFHTYEPPVHPHEAHPQAA